MVIILLQAPQYVLNAVLVAQGNIGQLAGSEKVLTYQNVSARADTLGHSAILIR
jgi:hypothetical protein